jgi:hypothetical protein
MIFYVLERRLDGASYSSIFLHGTSLIMGEKLYRNNNLPEMLMIRCHDFFGA